VKISAVHPEHTKDSVGYAFDFDGIRVYNSGDTKNQEKLRKVASFCADVAWMNAMNEISP